MHRIHYVCKFPVIVLLIFVLCFLFSVLVVLMLMLCYIEKYTVSTASFQLHGALRVLHINERTTPMQAHSEAVNKFTCTTLKQNEIERRKRKNYDREEKETRRSKEIE